MQWNVDVQHDGQIGNEMDYFLRADYAGQSEMFVGELNLATIPSWAILNLRAGLNQDNWNASVWVTNATDEEYISNAFYIPNPFFAAIVPTWGNKRRMGVTLGYNFN